MAIINDETVWAKLDDTDAVRIWILETYLNCIQWWTKQPDIIPRALAWSNFRKFDKTEYQLLGEDVSFIQSVNAAEYVDQAVAIDDHIPTCPTDSNTLLEEVESLFKEVLDVRPDLVGRVESQQGSLQHLVMAMEQVMSPDVSCLKPDELAEQRFDDAL
ncbi:hypothetical protein Tco_1336149 [Tanacetum coccineum]